MTEKTMVPRVAVEKCNRHAEALLIVLRQQLAAARTENRRTKLNVKIKLWEECFEVTGKMLRGEEV